MRSSLLIAAFITTCCLPLRTTAADLAPERLLLGFEEDEIKYRILPVVDKFLAYMRPVEGGFDLNDRVGILGGSGGVGPTWKLRSGRASQGRFSLLLSGQKAVAPGDYVFGKGYHFAWDPLNFRPPETAPDRRPRLDGSYAVVGPFYQQLHLLHYWGGRGLAVSSSAFRHFFPLDWSTYDLLRFDVFSEKFANTFRIAVEDEDIQPPVVRNVRCEPDKWVTAEVDLQAAAAARGLDLNRMAGFTMVLVDGRYTKVWLDNVRLSKRGVRPAFDVARDNSPLELSEAAKAYYRLTDAPRPEVLPKVEPDRTPLRAEPPLVIERPVLDAVATAPEMPPGAPLPKPNRRTFISMVPCGWLAAYDNRRMLVGFTGYGERDAFAVQTLDGGRQWRGLDGGPRATTIPVPNPNHGAGQGSAVGARNDVIVLTNLGCCAFTAGMRLYSQKLTFTGTGWELRPEAALVDCEPRHCVANQSVLRLASGRLWCAYGLVGRLGYSGVNARYSDDDGLVWKSWREGRNAAVPGSFPTGPGVPGGCKTYSYEDPCIVPYGPNGIACLWYEVQHLDALTPSYTDILKWTRFDGKNWSPVEVVVAGQRKSRSGGWRTPVLAVSVGRKEVFLTSQYFPGVLHYDGAAWRKECVEIPPASQIAVAGDRTVMVFSAKDDATAIDCWRRRPGGPWSGPVEVMRGKEPIYSWTGIGKRLALVVHAYSPPNFVPIAWSYKDQLRIKVLRVPVE